MTADGRIASVNVNRGGVPKLPIDGAWVGPLGVEGDAHREPEPIHGGPDQAVCLYSVESIARVSRDGHTAFPGAFGENLTLEGIELDSLAAGDRLGIGEDGLVIEMTWPAAPCKTQAGWFIGGRFARISQKTHPEDARWYARVLSPGRVATGDGVTRLARAKTTDVADAAGSS